MWYYSQKNGNLAHDGALVGTGYSGNGAGLNNPDEQQHVGVGPLPQGLYTIGPAYSDTSKGPFVMRLTPAAGTNEFGRSGFLMHGDNPQVNHTGSDGCIVLARETRIKVSVSPDRQLTVTP